MLTAIGGSPRRASWNAEMAPLVIAAPEDHTPSIWGLAARRLWVMASPLSSFQSP